MAVAPDHAGQPALLMDVRMPGLTGVEATGRILDEWPHQGSAPAC
ncbi:hypothetical protein Ppa06_42940 [Planomonospora parontospora subsp. parontospora]|uniref:Uncharacterized protein n=2 Tax=Planomonospora parontospora TaxID=58119 RepID=A0AA37F6C9_9ACTN|nr:hypothetical protein GCM10010126_48790 [Planomonospora parontospora]GII10496.1 hypothetical protein Ppa06_42940 [Planomonospora parontospora subsp. parontospora]